MGKSTYTPKLAETICERLSRGEPLAAICRDNGMPGLRTVYDWADAHPEFAARFARAREEGEHAIAADCLRIADDLEDDPASRRVRTEVRLKLLAKWNPRKWGERIEHTGPEGGPVRIQVLTAVPPQTDAD